MTRPLLEIDRLHVAYQVRRKAPFVAVDDVSLSIAPGEAVGLVGESGSGKSTIGRAVVGLVPAEVGSIVFDGVDITHAGPRERRRLSADIQVVFQDPYGSLNPTRTIGQTLAETLRVHEKLSDDERRHRIESILERVGLPADATSRYPGQFSGGQRQRIAIARALIARPRLVICDEPVSALDLSVQAQVLNLLRELQEDLALSYLFIAHDLAVVRHLSHRIVVLYRGQIMEQGDAETVYERPQHPYTQALLAAAPVPDPDLQSRRRSARPARASDVAATTPAACPFASRCPWAVDLCTTKRPALESTPEGSTVACHRWRDVRADSATGANGFLDAVGESVHGVPAMLRSDALVRPHRDSAS